MRRLAPWIAGAAMVAAAGVLTVVTPSEDDLLRPFLMRGEAGATVSSRTVTAAMTEATFADRVTVDGSAWEAEGNWLVVTVVASGPLDEDDAVIDLATLVVDGRVFQASERPSTGLVGTGLRVGTDTVGMLAFELPDGLRSGSASLRLASELQTPHLDDVIAIALTLDEVPSTSSVEIAAPELGAP